MTYTCYNVQLLHLKKKSVHKFSRAMAQFRKKDVTEVGLWLAKEGFSNDIRTIFSGKFAMHIIASEFSIILGSFS